MAVSDLYTNRFETTLSSAMDASQLTLPLASITGLATSGGQIRFRIDSEIIIATAGASSPLTITQRGAEGTTAASHSSGATASAPVTAGSLQVITRIDTDELVIRRGAELWGPARVITPPNSGDWTALSGSVSNANGVMVVSGGLCVYTIPTPSSPWTAIVGMLHECSEAQYNAISLCAVDGSNQARAEYGFMQDNAQRFYGQRMNSSGGYVSDYYRNSIYQFRSQLWVKIQTNSTDRLVSYAADGYNWRQHYSTTKNEHITPGRVGIFASGIGTIFHFSFSQP